MAKMICKSCGCVFEDDEIVVKRMYLSGPYFPDSGYWDEDCQCPECGSARFEDAVQCEVCGAYKSSEDYEYDCEVCRDCMKDYVRKNPEEVWAFLKAEDVFGALSEYMSKKEVGKIVYKHSA